MTNIITVTIGKTGAAHEIDFAALPETSQQFIITYGLKQLLNDAHASITPKAYKPEDFDGLSFAEAVNAAVEEKLNRLFEGTLAIRAGTREPSDPRAKIIHQLAKDALREALKAKGLNFKAIGEEKVSELVAGLAAKNADAYGAEADRRLAAKASAGAEIDLSALGL